MNTGFMADREAGPDPILSAEWSRQEPIVLDDGTQVQLLKDAEALDAARDAIRGARHRIWLEVYMFCSDSVGREFARLLVSKARAGLDVRVIYDAVGSDGTNPLMFRRMRRAGVKVERFHALMPWTRGYRGNWWNRDHRKLLLVDENQAGMGGMNIGKDYGMPSRWRLRRNKVWRDTGVGIWGPAAKPLRGIFEQMWAYASGGDLPPPVPDHCPKISDCISLLLSDPNTPGRLAGHWQDLFEKAEHEILVTVAYFAPPQALVESLQAAARRGVRVRLLLPGKIDISFMMIAARSFYDPLLRAGVEIFELRDRMLHAKAVCVDRRISIIGSANLDVRSIEYNYELSSMIESPKLAEQMARMFEYDVARARPILLENWRHRPRSDRWRQAIVHAVREWL